MSPLFALSRCFAENEVGGSLQRYVSLSLQSVTVPFQKALSDSAVATTPPFWSPAVLARAGNRFRYSDKQ
jgi:hypothetical protein